jgi:two-component system CheB/CheR fusion protein
MAERRQRTSAAARSGPGQKALPVREPHTVAADFPVVGIGASAGGLDACIKLVSALPAGNGMAFILVQHLDPSHESMMVELLSGHTSMRVLQATDGMRLERDHFYVIPPGTYLSVSAGGLHLSQPLARHGSRLPFDFLLHSIAEEYGARAICVVLSGTGADGSLGLKAVKEKHGFVIAQDPDEAEYDGMPESAIATGLVDLVLPVTQIPGALVEHAQRPVAGNANSRSIPRDKSRDDLSGIIDLLRIKTAHDFRLYKPGTLQRRIERRMGMSGIETGGMGRYLTILQADAAELDLLARDLLINVTSFFRDPKIFEFVADKIVPDLVRNHAPNSSVRIWIAGCSTGEETYSLAMLFREEIAKAKLNIKLQVFASDVDPEAVAVARDGLYPETIAADISQARLDRFFSKEEGGGYRVLPELREAAVFTVQDVLADPPFSRLDFVSCRNLLIYLRPEAQARVISLFHFALRQGGILLLGSSETVGNTAGRFEVISKQERLYRRIGRNRPGELGFLMSAGDSARGPPRAGPAPASFRQTGFAELCRRLVIQTHAPAAILINHKNECLYSLGPTDRYLRVAPGAPSLDLLSMAREGLRSKLLSAIQQASKENTRVIVTGGRLSGGISFNIDIQPAINDGERLLLVCFVDKPGHERKSSPGAGRDIPRIAELERELVATKGELDSANRNLELSGEEQKAIYEEALSVNEEFQSTNEELLTSKEELQSLNEELTALNSQLQETLERQRTTANDLQNILYSTDVATIFLDAHLNIRFFTPATTTLFSVISSDVGRPLADFRSLAADGGLLTDAGTVLRTLAPLEREIEAQNGLWYSRRILPYRTQQNGVEGVVITFVDMTERKHTADALALVTREAELANIAKSRFLAAASHDLRQPLQTLALVQGLLTKVVEGEQPKRLVALLEPTLSAMSGMLNTLLDINQIDAGTVKAQVAGFPVNNLLRLLRDEFTYHAEAQGLTLTVVLCGLSIKSDPRLLEQMIRNLLSNAMKYTRRGRVLLGCRRHAGELSIEVWDTGIGIPEAELKAIFEEYHQIDNVARQRSLGLGLGHTNEERLGQLMGHKVSVRSQSNKGSVFSIRVGLAPDQPESRPGSDSARDEAAGEALRKGAILVVEDDPDVRMLLELALNDEGHRTTTAADGGSALELVARGKIRPDLVLADYNLPGGMDGLQLAAKLQERLRWRIPTIILTGDISTQTLRDVARQDCVHVNKPVNLRELTQTIQRLLPPSPNVARAPVQHLPETGKREEKPLIFIVDDDRHIRDGIRGVLEEDGRIVEDYASGEAFLEAYRPGGEGCLLIDAYLPGMKGLELLQRLKDTDPQLPAIMITGYSDVPTAVEAMKAGASDFIEKPIDANDLLARIDFALEHSRHAHKLSAWREGAAKTVAELTSRQRQIMELVLAGHPSKNIAADLGISQRTVENHRASIMKKTGSKSLPALARIALAASWNIQEEASVDVPRNN